MSRVKGQLPDWPRAKRRTPASPAGPPIIQNVRCRLSPHNLHPLSGAGAVAGSSASTPKRSSTIAANVVDVTSSTLFGGRWDIDHVGPLGRAQRQVAQPVFWR